MIQGNLKVGCSTSKTRHTSSSVSVTGEGNPPILWKNFICKRSKWHNLYQERRIVLKSYKEFSKNLNPCKELTRQTNIITQQKKFIKKSWNKINIPSRDEILDFLHPTSVNALQPGKDKDQRECLSMVIQKEKDNSLLQGEKRKTLIPDTSKDRW